MCWKEREQARFADGTYKPVPVPLDYPADHFVHLSITETETDTVAYTPSEAYGEADRQVRLKFGRYLRKAFPDLTDVQVQAHVISLKSALAVMDAPVTLHFATDRETINRIFETPMCACGSTYLSCMHGKFSGEVRPYHVYADSPDVAVAYITAQGEIRARSVVSTKNKVWIRCYSIQSGDNDADCGTLKAMLKDAGYTKGELDGNRLTKLNTNRVMLPYIDNDGREVASNGKYWIVVEDGEGEYKAEKTDGTAEPCGARCSCCEELEENCQCYYCECCEERYPDGCDRCSMCEHCNRCITHAGCDCARCSECSELIESYRGCSSCECDRCSECNGLESECECDKCDACGRLASDCECEEETEEQTDTETPATSLEIREIRLHDGTMVRAECGKQLAIHRGIGDHTRPDSRSTWTLTLISQGLAVSVGLTKAQARFMLDRLDSREDWTVTPELRDLIYSVRDEAMQLEEVTA